MAEAKEQCKEWGDECVLFEKEADMLPKHSGFNPRCRYYYGWNSEGYDIPIR